MNSTTEDNIDQEPVSQISRANGYGTFHQIHPSSSSDETTILSSSASSSTTSLLSSRTAVQDLESRPSYSNPIAGCMSEFGARYLPISLVLENRCSTARDNFSIERTFLSWLRMSTTFSLIGIVIYFRFHLPTRDNGEIILDPAFAKPIGAAFITCGLFTLGWALSQYFRFQEGYIKSRSVVENDSNNFIVAMLIGIVIVFALSVNIFQSNRNQEDNNGFV